MTSFSRSSYIAFFCASTFYMYQFVLRVSPSVMISDMMASFSTDAAGIAFLSSISLYAYSFMQIPVGILADLWGPRRLILISIFLCIFGSLLVANTDHFGVATMGRIIIGVGSASAFLSVAKVSLEGFGVKHQSLFFGFTMTAGTIGALNGGNTVAYLLEIITWRETLVLLSGVGILVAILNYYGLKEKSTSVAETKTEFEKETSKTLSSLLSIFKSRQCWISGFVALGIYSTISVLADLWGVSFCMQVYHLSRIKAAHLTSLLYVGLCIGSIAIPLLSRKIHPKPLIIGCLGGILINLLLLFFSSDASFVLKGILFFNIGFFAGAEMLCFAHACRIGSSRNSGTITGFINGAVMMGGATLQYIFGIILDASWQGLRDHNGTPLYTEQGYYTAFSAILGAVLLSLFLSFFLFSSPLKEESVSFNPNL